MFEWDIGKTKVIQSNQEGEKSRSCVSIDNSVALQGEDLG